MRILVVDDDPSFNEIISNFLRRKDYSVDSVHSSVKALKELANGEYDLVLCDYKLPDLNGLELIGKIKSEYSGLPVILITNYADVRVAVDSIKLGAFEFVTKPVNPDELLKIIRLSLSRQDQAVSEPPQEVNENYVIGKNIKTSELWRQLKVVAPAKMNTLIIGESGTGKEYIARKIHHLSRRQKEPFIALDCGALPVQLAGSELFGHVKGAFTGAQNNKKGLFEEASNGTLFLDEVGNLPYETQILLLRTIQEGVIKRIGDNKEIKVDVRLIAATNDDLEDSVQNKTFRNDLYHRLNEFELRLPPLRERLDDLDEFCHYFIKQASAELEKPPVMISDEVRNAFLAYHWPGNLRELKNIIRRAVLLTSGNLISLDTLPQGLKTSSNVKTAQQDMNIREDNLNIKTHNKNKERQLIINALEKYKYNKTKAAKALNIDRSTLYSKINQYGIDI